MRTRIRAKKRLNGSAIFAASLGIIFTGFLTYFRASRFRLTVFTSIKDPEKSALVCFPQIHPSSPASFISVGPGLKISILASVNLHEPDMAVSLYFMGLLHA